MSILRGKLCIDCWDEIDGRRNGKRCWTCGIAHRHKQGIGGKTKIFNTGETAFDKVVFEKYKLERGLV